VSTEIIQEDV